ncbi:MAG: subtype B tannase [Eubacteriales bacterium]|nr:subtype B tannase [Eubacteriales bacterium]
MNFDKNRFQTETVTLNGETVRFRSWRNLSYVDRPVNPEFQQMNIFAPEDYFEGKSINGYRLATAPVFMPNTVGGYMPGMLNQPGCTHFGPARPNSIFCALQHGYVVAAPAIRGRTQKDESGKFTGKAPACIVDYKAAVRYLHYFAADLPGDENKIITNGTSAGGALSALMGACGNHPDYEPYLKALGAADAGDEIFAASCYCPITNLDHADMAYEWQFLHVNDYHRRHMKLNEGGRPSFTPVDADMTPLQIKTSAEEAAMFPAYVNSLQLKDHAGSPLVLDRNGEGSFKEYVKQIVLASAQRAIDNGLDVSDKKWLTVKNNKAVAMDFAGYVKDITRMKTAPAFDDLTMNSPENNLFGSETTDCRHFTAYSSQNSLADGSLAESGVVKLLNPMYYIEDEKAVTAKHWRIRHGECDRDTSLAISAMLTVKLQNNGARVDYHAPWDTPHSGDYDLEELFAWIDSICK